MGLHNKFTAPGFVSLSAATTGAGKVASLAECPDVTWSIVGSSGVSAGAVVIESSRDPAYAGTWKVVAGPVTVVADTELGDKFGGPVPGGFVRARVSTNLTGGTVSVFLNGLTDD